MTCHNFFFLPSLHYRPTCFLSLPAPIKDWSLEEMEVLGSLSHIYSFTMRLIKRKKTKYFPLSGIIAPFVCPSLARQWDRFNLHFDNNNARTTRPDTEARCSHISRTYNRPPEAAIIKMESDIRFQQKFHPVPSLSRSLQRISSGVKINACPLTNQ